MTVLERRFPSKALLIVAGCLLYFVVALILVGGALASGQGLKGKDIGVAMVLAVAAIALLVLKGKVLIDYARGPGHLAFGDGFLECGDERIAYADIDGLDTSNKHHHALRILRSGRAPIMLHWEIWPGIQQWGEVLQQAIAGRLVEDTLRRIEHGETVGFGRGLALDRQGLHVGRTVVPLAQVSDMQTVRINDADRIQIHVRGQHNPLFVIGAVNLPVFFEAVRRLSPPGPTT